MINFDSKENGMLSKILLKNYPTLSFAELKVLFRKKDIKINGKRVNQDVAISTGDNIVVYNKEKTVDVIYEDVNIMIVHKPYGVETTTIDKSYSGKSLEEMTGCYACHRLDMNTEGIVILAKTESVRDEIFAEFKKGNVHKTYIALVKGEVKKIEDTLNHYLVKGDDRVYVYKDKVKDASNIITKYKVLEVLDDMTKVEVDLVTGKTHQIRAHMAYIGHPVVGDNKYGDKDFNKSKGVKKQCLCAYKVELNFESGRLKYLNGVEYKTAPHFKI